MRPTEEEKRKQINAVKSFLGEAIAEMVRKDLYNIRNKN